MKDGSVKQMWFLQNNFGTLLLLPESQQTTCSDTVSTWEDIIMLLSEPCIRESNECPLTLQFGRVSERVLMCGHVWTGSRALREKTLCTQSIFPARKKASTVITPAKGIISTSDLVFWYTHCCIQMCFFVYPISVSKSPLELFVDYIVLL